MLSCPRGPLDATYSQLATRQVVTQDGPHRLAELVTLAATLRAASFPPAVPSACPCIGNWRSLTVNNRSIHGGSDPRQQRRIRPRRRDRTRLPSTRPGPHWAHIGATNDQIAADNTGHQRSGILPAHQPDSALRRRSPPPPRGSLARRIQFEAGVGRSHLRRPSSAGCDTTVTSDWAHPPGIGRAPGG
jgi:hypothetical protein